MSVHGLATKADYDGFVRKNPQELDLLFKEMLIGVTSFFRDPEVWQELKDSVLPVCSRAAPKATAYGPGSSAARRVKRPTLWR